MLAGQLVKEIRKVRGKLYVPVHSVHDVYYIAAEKKDLITVFGSMPVDQESYMQLNLNAGAYYLETVDEY